MSRNAEQYPEPEEFRPERYLTPSGDRTEETSEFTFGFGRRYVLLHSCIPHRCHNPKLVIKHLPGTTCGRRVFVARHQQHPCHVLHREGQGRERQRDPHPGRLWWPWARQVRPFGSLHSHSDQLTISRRSHGTFGSARFIRLVASLTILLFSRSVQMCFPPSLRGCRAVNP